MEDRSRSVDRTAQPPGGPLAVHAEDVFGNSPTAFFILDRDLRVLWVNDAATKFFGIPAEEIIGQYKPSLVRERLQHVFSDPQGFAGRVLRAYETNDSDESFDCHVVAGPGRPERWLHHWSHPIHKGPAAGGRVEQYIDVTRREQARAELAASEERHRLIVEGAHDYAILTTDARGRIESWSPGAEAVFGWTAEEAVGQPLAITFTPDDRAAGEVEREREMALREGAVPDARWHQRKDGSRVFVDGWTRLLHGADGGVRGFLKIAEDVTLRRAAEEALWSREELFRQIAENVRDVFWIFTPDFGKAIYISPSFEPLTGIPAAALYEDARAFLAPMHPDDVPRVLEAMKRVRHERVVGVEFRYFALGGGTRWFRARGYPVRDAEGNVFRVVGISEDITDARMAEAALRESERRLQQILDALPVGVSLADDGGRIVWKNPAAEAVWAGATGRKAAALERAVHGEITNGEITEMPGEEKRTIRNHAVPLRDETGRIAGAVGVHEDITAQRRLEEQLQHAQRMEAVGRLAGGVAHDFNNQLTAILGFTKLLELEIPQGQGLELYLTQIEKAAERSARLTHQLLAFSRRQVLQPRVLELGEVVEGMDMLLRRLIGKDVELVTLPSAEGRGTVRADPSQLEQVLVNLVVNARDALPAGGRITIRIVPMKLDRPLPRRPETIPPGDYLVLSVADNGEGMDEPTLQRIFEPFFTTKDQGKGTGLGLSMVLGIVKQSGGHISVDSEPGVGTTFRIFLPRVEEEAEREARPTAEGPAPEHGTVLVAEDEPAVRVLAARTLKRAGYEVLEAENGEEALRVWGAHRGDIDLVLTDLAMPLMGGRELGRRLAADPKRVPILYMSGYTDDFGSEEPLTESQLLPKPFQPKTLVERVAAALREAASR